MLDRTNTRTVKRPRLVPLAPPALKTTYLTLPAVESSVTMTEDFRVYLTIGKTTLELTPQQILALLEKSVQSTSLLTQPDGSAVLQGIDIQDPIHMHTRLLVCSQSHQLHLSPDVIEGLDECYGMDTIQYLEAFGRQA